MKQNKLQQALDNCPRMVAVFMVNQGGDDCRAGDIIYWNWERNIFTSHYRDVNVKPENLEFIGYAPTLDLNGHQWPNMCELMERKKTGRD